MATKRDKEAAFDEGMFRGGSRASATSKMERFVIIVNGWCSNVDVEAALDPSLICIHVR